MDLNILTFRHSYGIVLPHGMFRVARPWIILIVMAFIGFTPAVYTQVVSLDWQKCLGGTGSEYGEAICAGFNSDYYVATTTRSGDGDITVNFGGSDIWLARLNIDGSMIWQKSIGGSYDDYPESIITTFDSCLVICGHSSSADGLIDTNYGLGDIVVFKLDTLGNIIWQTVIPGSDHESGFSIIQTSDDGYLLTGYSYSNDGLFTDHIGDTEYADAVVVKLNPFGAVEWSKSYGSDREDVGREIIETTDGNFLLVGNKWGGLALKSQYYITKITSTGDVIWEQLYGGSDYDYAHAVVEISPGRYLVTGDAYSSDGDVIDSHGSREAWTILLDNSGEMVWSRAYGGTGADFGRSVIKLGDNSFGISGGTVSPNNGDVIGFHGGGMVADVWVLAIDSLSIIQWQRCLGGTGPEDSGEIVSNGSEIVIAGYTKSNDGDVSGIHGGPPYMSDTWVVKLSMNCTPEPYYADVDNDGYGNPDVYVYSCTDTIGYILDNTDCIDTNALIHPGAIELCNSIDDNCDGNLDDGFVYTVQYADADGDSYGNQAADTLACPGIAGYVTDSLDCNDNNPDIHPGAVELLNGLDDDCDGVSDEGLPVTSYGSNLMRIYPVPAATYIEIEADLTSITLLQVYNQSGALVMQVSDWHGEKIYIGNLPSALYGVRLIHPNGVSECLFIKE